MFCALFSGETTRLRQWCHNSGGCFPGFFPDLPAIHHAVRRNMPRFPTPAPAVEPPALTHHTVGQRLRQIRRVQHLSLKTLAARAEVSVGMISQIERDQVNPSIRVLEKLRLALHVPLSALLEDGGATTPAQGLPLTQEFVRRADQRPQFRVGDKGLMKELLSPPGNHNLQVMTILLPAHTRSELVLEGAIALTVAHHQTLLNAGDSFQFSSAIPHGVANPTDAPARVLWIISTERPVI